MNDIIDFIHAKTVNPPTAPKPELAVGTQFQIKTGTFKGEKFTVTKLTPADTFDVVCADAKGNTMCFRSAQLAIYGIRFLEPETEFRPNDIWMHGV